MHIYQSPRIVGFDCARKPKAVCFNASVWQIAVSHSHTHTCAHVRTHALTHASGA